MLEGAAPMKRHYRLVVALALAGALAGVGAAAAQEAAAPPRLHWSFSGPFGL
jgi:Spy/CpxP family protein refolding chaperone